MFPESHKLSKGQLLRFKNQLRKTYRETRIELTVTSKAPKYAYLHCQEQCFIYLHPENVRKPKGI